MARLTGTELASRLAFDYRVVSALESPVIGRVRWFGAHGGLLANRELDVARGEAGQGTVLVVEYLFPVLVGPGETTPRTEVRFDVLAGGNYPYTAPAVLVVSRPLPWSPHVHPASGIVCLGETWDHGRGHMLLGQLVIHVMRILNCDEPDRGAWYSGWNGAAVRYWRTTLGCRPLNPDLAYPRLPTELTHGTADELDMSFACAHEAEGHGFRKNAHISPASAFKPLSRTRTRFD